MGRDRFDDAPWLDPPRTPRVLTRAEARAAGYTPRMIDHRLARGTWRRVLPRTYLTVDTFTWLDRQRAALAFAGPRSLLSGAAALTDLGLRSVRTPQRVLVLVPSDVRLESSGFVRVRATHRMPPRELAPGPRRACVARAVADLARETSGLDDVRALVAEVVRRRHCELAELAHELALGRRNGSAHLREAIEEIRGGAWSAPEARAATLLTRAGLGPFEQNARIDLPTGRWVVVDFLWRALRAVLEIDSDDHHGLPADADATDARHLELEAAGYSVVHRRPRVIVREPGAFVAGIRRWLAGRAALTR